MKIVETEVQVRYQETDQMGVVYHANYLVWFEIGRTLFIEALGFKYHEIEQSGFVSPVINANVNYKRPCRFGQKATVTTWLADYNGFKVTYGYKVTDEAGDIAVTGSTEHVVVNKESFRPLSIRRSFPDWHEAYTLALED